MKNIRYFNSVLVMVMVFTITLLLSCKKTTNSPQVECNPEDHYPQPEQVDDGWTVASLEETGMCSTFILEMVDDLRNGVTHKIHGIVVIKDGKLVVEEYFDGYTMDNDFKNYDRETLHFQASVSKSVTSALFGIAFDKGFITDLNSTISTYFPQYHFMYLGDRKHLNVKHLLTMSSGLDWDEWSYPYDDLRNDVTQLFNLADPIEFILSKPMHAFPGEVFHYNSGVTNVLGEIVRSKSGETLLRIARENLFEPLGITDYYWEVLPPSGVVFASGGLHLRPRDMAKIGQLFLQKGIWNGNRIISEEWIDESTKASEAAFSNPWFPNFCWGYGYQWWLGTYSNGNHFAFYAAGWGDQFIIVIPDIQMVVVITGGAYYEGSPFPVYNYIVNDHLIPSLN